MLGSRSWTLLTMSTKEPSAAGPSGTDSQASDSQLSDLRPQTSGPAVELRPGRIRSDPDPDPDPIPIPNPIPSPRTPTPIWTTSPPPSPPTLRLPAPPPPPIHRSPPCLSQGRDPRPDPAHPADGARGPPARPPRHRRSEASYTTIIAFVAMFAGLPAMITAGGIGRAAASALVRPARGGPSASMRVAAIYTRDHGGRSGPPDGGPARRGPDRDRPPGCGSSASAARPARWAAWCSAVDRLRSRLEHP